MIGWLRGAEYDLEAEVRELENLATDPADKPSLRTLLSIPFLAPLFIVSTLFFFHGSIGYDDLSFYSLVIFQYPGVDISPSLIAILFQLAFTVGLLAAPLIMSRLGRRPQVIGGGGGLAVCLFGLGAYHYFNLTSLDSVHPVLAYAPVAGLVLLGLLFGLGIGPVPYTLTGELFPQPLKSLGCGIGIAARYAGAFIQLQVISSILNEYYLRIVF